MVADAVIQVAGTALYWKDDLYQILRSSGLSQRVVDEYRLENLFKFQVMRKALNTLTGVGAGGWKVQRRIVAQLVNLERPDVKAPDQEAGKRALAELRRPALEAELVLSPDEFERRQRRAKAERDAEDRSRRTAALEELRRGFIELSGLADKQRRGLEKLLNGLFHLDELRYDTSYKTETDQVDGIVTIESFLYLVEARWRDAPAVDADLGGFFTKHPNVSKPPAESSSRWPDSAPKSSTNGDGGRATSSSSSTGRTSRW